LREIFLLLSDYFFVLGEALAATPATTSTSITALANCSGEDSSRMASADLLFAISDARSVNAPLLVVIRHEVIHGFDLMQIVIGRITILK
jgi:hypothetical protein